MKISGKVKRLYRFLNALDSTPWEKPLEEDGGPGSGNWGHRGRPGKVGGSGKGGGKQYRGGRGDIAYHGSRSDWLNGLTGERQKEAQSFLKRWRGQYAVGEEANKSVEQNIMEDHGATRERAQLLTFMSEARGWDRFAGRLTDENWDDDDRKLAGALMSKYGLTQAGGMDLPDDADTSGWDDDDLRCWQDLKSKAMGGPTSGKAAPDELQYAAGLKERPKPAGPQIPKTPQETNEWFAGLPEESQQRLRRALSYFCVSTGQDFSSGTDLAAIESSMLSMMPRMGLMQRSDVFTYLEIKNELLGEPFFRDLQGVIDGTGTRIGNLNEATSSFLADGFRNYMDAYSALYAKPAGLNVPYNVLSVATKDKDAQIAFAKVMAVALGMEGPSRTTNGITNAAALAENALAAETARMRAEKATKAANSPEAKKKQQAAYAAKSPQLETRLRAAKSEADVQDIMRDSGMFRQQADIDLDHMGADQAARTALGMRAVFEKYPFLVGAISSIRPDAEVAAVASCSMDSDGTPLHINEKYYSTQRSHDSLDVMQRLGVATKFHPAGTEADGVKATIVHELGHALDGYITRALNKSTLNFSRAKRKFVRTSLANELRRSVAKACGVTIGEKHHRPMIEALSDYGTYNAQEWFAECFCEAICSPNPRPMAREFMRQLDEIIRKNSIQ